MSDNKPYVVEVGFNADSLISFREAINDASLPVIEELKALIAEAKLTLVELNASRDN